MNTNNFHEVYNQVNRKILSNRFLDKLGLDKIKVESHIKGKHFMSALNFLLNENDFSCNRILSLFKDLLDEMAYPNAPDNWLDYIYQYTLSKSFPEAVSIILIDSLNACCELYLRALKILSEVQKFSDDDKWQSLYPLFFLSVEEEEGLENPDEYKKFVKSFKHNFIYELMKLSDEIFGYNTLDHICGVHYLALFIARQLKSIDIPVDLGRVSGAAAGHDIGKYGCKPSELRRVPYLHYYYTDQWFKAYGINYIRNIAVNHSTWDLELENLPLESLILIYSDFRVKNKYTDKGTRMHIFTLKDSFDVILSKLDNVDEKKEKRYKKVYGKLKDFEDFMISLGIEADIKEISKVFSLNTSFLNINYSLMQGQDVINNIKYLSISHNINLMFQLRDEYSLDKILESARSEQDWKNLREYIRIFEEYSTYLTQNQKIQTMKFLYENLIHPEDDIRRHCAELIGTLIAIFDEDYRKEIPEKESMTPPGTTSFDLLKEYLDLLLYPGHKVIQAHRFWLGYSISIIIDSLFEHCRKNYIPTYRKIIMEYYNNKTYKNYDSHIFLLECVKFIPIEPFDDELKIMFQYIIANLNKHSNTLKVCALASSIEIVKKDNADSEFIFTLNEFLSNNSLRSKSPTENLLKYNLAKLISPGELSEKFNHYCNIDERKIPDIFLSNLKTATDWIKKRTQISLLLRHALKNIKTNGLHTAIHFCNLLKVSAVEAVRNDAGIAIIKIMPHLSLAERNEVAVELLRALEIEGNRFTEYIPFYLGQIILWLEPKELNEIIDDLVLKIKTSSPNVKTLILKTIGICISNYPSYVERFSEDTDITSRRLITMLGILLNGLSDYAVKTKQSAISVIGKDIFGSSNLSLDQKQIIFKLIAKKLLTLVTDNKNEELLFLSNSATLNHTYRFISDYTFIYGFIDLPVANKIAFFPGTFDPFSLSHKEISKHVRDLGYEVYLAVDEFSWSKKTLPNRLRRNILNMSIADELGIYIYPDNTPTNIANFHDLNTLKENFPNSEVYLAVGSDVIMNASSYKAPKTENSIHSFNHIIFERVKSKKNREYAKQIEGKIQWVTLPAKYSDISSTQIRNYIDENRDISSLIDPLAQNYIYENGFYQREPQDKSLLSSLWLKIDVVDNYSEGLVNDIYSIISTNTNKEDLKKNIKEHFEKPSGRMITLKNILNHDELIGFSSFHWVRSSMLYDEIKDADASRYIRQNSSGRVVLIDEIIIKNSEKNKSLEQILITETLAFCISRDYQYTIYKKASTLQGSNIVEDILKLQGFIEINSSSSNLTILVVDMSSPCVCNLDLENIIKEPFRSNPKVKQVISITRKKLQQALIKLYPGELVLSFDSNMLHQSMIRKICRENHVSTKVSEPRNLGNAMCVPYGDILERYAIPNTVTKALHTEKFFSPDINSFKIAEFPYYLDLETQVKMLKSFNRPVILVDNILHKGYRMKALDPLFKNEGIKVQKIIAGILTGRGKDLMDMQARQVDSVYFIPKLKIWFNENSLYPFIGGDAIWRGSFPKRNLLPSINLIMPYTSPTFIHGSTLNSIYNLSRVCIENAIDILTTLENEYHLIHEKNLSLYYLGQVFTIPRCPERGKDMEYNLSINPSHYLKNDLEVLYRYENLMNYFNGGEKHDLL